MQHNRTQLEHGSRGHHRSHRLSVGHARATMTMAAEGIAILPAPVPVQAAAAAHHPEGGAYVHTHQPGATRMPPAIQSSTAGEGPAPQPIHEPARNDTMESGWA